MNYLDYVMAMKAKTLSAEEKEQSNYLLSKLVELLLGAQKEGLLHLEETAWEIPETTPVNKFLRKAVLMIVDGTDPEVVKQVMGREIVFLGTETFEAYLCYVALQGVFAIQLGYSRYLFNDTLIHCFLTDYREEARKLLEDKEHKYMEELRARHLLELPKRLPHRSENPYLPHIMASLERLDDEKLYKFANEVRSNLLMIIMEFSPAELRTRLLESVPEPVWEIFLENYHFTKEDELAEALQIVAKELNAL